MRLERTRDGTLSWWRIDDLYIVDVTKERKASGQEKKNAAPWIRKLQVNFTLGPLKKKACRFEPLFKVRKISASKKTTGIEMLVKFTKTMFTEFARS